MQDEITVGVLGPVQVTRPGTSIGIGGTKPQLVLAMLVLHRGEVVSSGRLCEVLWGDAQPPSAPASLQSHVSRLRSSLSPAVRISARPSGYCLELADRHLDAARFEALTSQARAAHHVEDAARDLADALKLWRGAAYGELATLEWFQGEARRLEELRLGAIEDWLQARLDNGDELGVVGELESMVTQHPLRERFWRQLMTALYRSGRQAEAVRRGATLRAVLRDELGLDPSPSFRDLESRILRDDPALARPQRAPAHAATQAARSRPASEPNSFVGRTHAVTQLDGALLHQRLVTVTGPGGVGKTRLARRATGLAGPRFRHGVAVVELAHLRDAPALGQVVAAALDVQQRQHRTIDDTIVEFLHDRELLVVLDNCEHLIEHVAALVQRLLLRCPLVTILTTSREPLRLPGEYVHVLEPLAAPAVTDTDLGRIASSPAVELFIDRAAAASPGFELTAGNATVVADICRRLDGLPLALELAAARLRALGPVALAGRLDRGLDLLGSGRSSADTRQRTLSDLVEWFYDLLDQTEREVFAQLSVFAGSFDLEDAAALCRVEDDAGGEVIDVLANLVDKSMVQLSDPEGPRYHLLETLREFGHQRLRDGGTDPAVEQRHLRWYLELARRGRAGLDSPEEPVWSRRLDQELDNFRAADACAVRGGDADRAARLVADLQEQSIRRLRYELSSWADATIELLAGADHPLLGVVLAVSAYGRWARGDLEPALELAGRAARLQEGGDPTERTGLPERVMGNALFYLGRTAEALGWIDRLVDIARHRDSAAQLAHALYMRSVAQTSVGDPIRGAVLAGEASAAVRRCGSRTAAAQADYALGLALQESDPAAAIRHLRQSALHAEVGGNRWLSGFALTEVHWLVAREGEPLEALRGFAAVIDAWYRGGDWANQWLSLRHVQGILIELGEHHPAVVLQGALTATGAAYALPYEPAAARRLADDVLVVRELLGPAEFAAATRLGTAMSDDQVVTFALEQIERLTGGRPAT